MIEPALDAAADPPRPVSELPVAAGPDRAQIPLSFLASDMALAPCEGIVTIDEAQRIVMINPAAQRMFRCAASDVLGKNLSVFIPPRLRRSHAAHVRKFDKAGTVERPMGERTVLTGLRMSGEEFPMEATISRLDMIGEAGGHRFFTALIRDLSEVNVLRSEIDALNRRLRTIFEMAPIAIWITDGDSIIFANRACATLFGTNSNRELVGRSIYSLIEGASQPAVRQAVERALTNEGPTSTGVHSIARADGTTREVEIAVAALPDHGRTALQMAITDITGLSNERRELERSRQELRQLSAGMVDAREEERRRIARELHDELGQRLTALHMELSSVKSIQQTDDCTRRIDAMLGMVDETVASVRRIATELRPLMLDDLGLNAAIEWLAESWARRMDITVRLDLDDEDPSVSEGTAIALYRMVQEALTNIARHAHATRVSIRMRQRSGELELTVHDNGIGFTEKALQREGSHGLKGIRERAYMLGGHLEIGSSRIGGARIRVRVPLVAKSTLVATSPA